MTMDNVLIVSAGIVFILGIIALWSHVQEKKEAKHTTKA